MRFLLNVIRNIGLRVKNSLFSSVGTRISSFLKTKHFNSLNDKENFVTLEKRIDDCEAQIKQLSSIIQKELNLPLPPPKHLQIRVVGSYHPDFIESGFSSIYPVLNRILKTDDKKLKDFRTILDFGCGCGRAIRALATLVPESKLYGTDIDEEAIQWLKNNYSKFAEFYITPHLPPTEYKEEMFDFIFGISVLTHLPEDMQFQWLAELNRITKRNGYVVLTTHGEKHYLKLDSNAAGIMKKKGFYYHQAGFNYGKSISLPDFYQTAYHSHDYIKREWSIYFQIVDIHTLGIDNHQDVILLKKV